MGKKSFLSNKADDAIHSALHVMVLLQWIERARDALATVEFLEQSNSTFRDSHAAISINIPTWDHTEAEALADLAFRQEHALRGMIKEDRHG